MSENNIELNLNKTNEEYIYEWEQELRVSKKSEKTIRQYVNVLSRFSRFLGNKSFINVFRKDIIDFINNDKLKESTAKNLIMYIKIFYNWMCNPDVGYMGKSPISKTIPIKIPKRDRNYLSIEEYEIIKSYLKKQLNYKKSRTHYMLFTLAFATGLRASELVALKVEDIDFENDCLNTIGKGNKERTVGFKWSATVSIKNYLQLNKITTGYIFPKEINNIYAGHITSGCFNKLCENISKRTKIHLYPHLERHGHAVAYLDAGGSMEVLQEQYGHEKIETTLIYGQIRKNRQLKEAHEFAPDI
jgi:site-specific recombinase XerD